MKRTRRFLPKYVSGFPDRHGRERLRFRRGTFSHYMKATLGTEAFRIEYAACLRQEQPELPSAGGENILAGSYADLISRYYRSSKWLGRTEKARAHDKRIIDRFRDEHGARSVAGTTYERADKIIGDKASTPTAANKLRKILRRLLGYGVAIGMVDTNPFLEVGRVHVPGTGYHEWTEEEVARYQEHHPYGTKARLAMELLLWTGQRRSDGRLMGRQQTKDGRIRVVQGKTGQELWLPMAAQLVWAITSMPYHPHMTYLVTEYGAPYSVGGFGNKFRQWCDEAGLPQCTAHGLRKVMARRLGNLGQSNLALKSIGGWKTDSEVARYTKGFDQMALADAAIAALSQWELSNRPQSVRQSRVESV